jgi:hypothetical protein
MHTNKIFYTLILASLLLTSCMTETRDYLPRVPTDITLYSEFSMEDDLLHKKMYDYFNLECADGSSMSVVTPLHLEVKNIKKNVIDNSTQYKIVIGNNISGNTIYYSSLETEKLADDIAKILNEFLANYDQEYAHTINNVLPFKSHYLDHNSFLSTLANDPEELATTFKIGIDNSLALEDKTQLVINLIVYLAKTLGSECLYAIPNTSELQFSMQDCQCPMNSKSIDDENWVM